MDDPRRNVVLVVLVAFVAVVARVVGAYTCLPIDCNQTWVLGIEHGYNMELIMNKYGIKHEYNMGVDMNITWD